MITKGCLKVSVLGCGWAGLPAAAALVKNGYTVKGSTTHLTNMPSLALNGVLPYRVIASLTLEGERVTEFFNTDVLIVTLPPPRMQGLPDYHLKVHREIAAQAIRSNIQRVILYSSTSVYPENQGVVGEDDATVTPSAHSGVSLLEIERCYTLNAQLDVVVLRFGGLVGPMRHPGKFLRERNLIVNSAAPVNMVHLDDVVGATVFAIEKPLLAGAYNVVAPEETTRGDFYKAALIAMGQPEPACDELLGHFKRVSSARIQNAGYTFKQADLVRWLRTPDQRR
jgi:nucleoside-diphosphate-sugar epimerase